jgi:serine/threonine protein kinase
MAAAHNSTRNKTSS